MRRRTAIAAAASAAALGVPALVGCGGGGAAAPAPAPGEPPASGRPPSFLVVVSDDQRWDTLGCAGHPVVRTPVIDALARRGTRFSQAFVTTPICAASRATLLTGAVERSHGYTFDAPPLGPAWLAASYPARLRAAGYRTALIGKFDVRLPAGGREQLFDHFVEILQNPAFKTLPDGSRIHETDLCAQRAVEWLAGLPADQPFCLDLHFNAPHAEYTDLQTLYPWPPSVDGLYDDLSIPPPRLADPAIFAALPAFLRNSFNRDQYFWCCDEPAKYQRMMRAHLRMISGLDAAVGRVLAEIERQGRTRDTVVVFMSDNGYYLGERGLAGKWSHFSESVRIPWVVADPRLPASLQGRIDATLARNIDLAPTLLDLAGLPAPAAMQGRSLAPALRGQPDPRGVEDFLCEHLWPHPSIPRWEGLRTRRHVYARYLDASPAYEFVHDLEADPDELRNLAQDPAADALRDGLRRRCDALIAAAAAARL